MSWQRWNGLFSVQKPVIGMLHLPALPGSPNYSGQPIDQIIEYVLRDVKALEAGGIDGYIVENQGDVPFARPEDLGPSTVASLTAVTAAVIRKVTVPVGVNCMANGAVQALAVAQAAGGSFIRVSQWVNAYVGNSGLVNGAAPKALRYRSMIRAHDVLVFADVHVKHGSHAIVGDRSLVELAQDTAWYGADALVVTGSSTGTEASTKDVQSCQAATGLPTVLGSGVTTGNVAQMLGAADAAIVGTSLKAGQVTTNAVDAAKAVELMDAVRALR